MSLSTPPEDIPNWNPERRGFPIYIMTEIPPTILRQRKISGKRHSHKDMRQFRSNTSMGPTFISHALDSGTISKYEILSKMKFLYVIREEEYSLL